ncbi:cytochrome c oxidase assembly protein COX18, mitochondrial [Entelurus aequoreus]|uniref:cytochrome c oxidase assembly protein COX18, mitochondrial n=1 Tax=Entelurus aequoreus TaxID=161455 RepID=UPI002B1E81F7|nr:cytochrome c oxidase assembly protein COX18, mitochondrial [Entelurus aequoreus]XP_061895981.1 cytochrome c oxidase assembly protein COX18, mitochondrial [Entelurus aequoreus]XP_061895982.1 cytochrome c oxidase assembly protein COX18, mitochondrial [Entelurus aequoreus]
MLALGGLRLLRLPARAACGAAFLRRSSPSATHSDSSAGHRLSSGDAASGWYHQVSHSAPVHLAEDFLVHVQQSSGLPWWLSIVVGTLSVRTLVTLPLAAYQLVILGKVEALQAEIAVLAKRLRYEVSLRAKERGWTDKQCRFQFRKNLRRVVSQLYIRDNCHPFKASLLVWVQLPLWISLSLALRNLSLEELALRPDLMTGGALWFANLTSPDATWLLPLSLGLVNLLTVEVFSLQRSKESSSHKWLTNAMRGFALLMIPVAAAVPSSMALYWFSSSVVGLGHNLLLRSPALHKLLKVPSRCSDTPYRDLLAALVAKYRK